jgi:hypothetical protein
MLYYNTSTVITQLKFFQLLPFPVIHDFAAGAVEKTFRLSCGVYSGYWLTSSVPQRGVYLYVYTVGCVYGSFS